MIVDTSAIIAILQNEPQGPVISWIMANEAGLCMAAGTMIELLTVAFSRRGADGAALIGRLVQGQGIAIAPTTEEDVRIVAEAYPLYGKGMGRHGATAAARLNLGDCFAYALARRTGAPLLCVGDDFARTGVPLVSLEAP